MTLHGAPAYMRINITVTPLRKHRYVYVPSGPVSSIVDLKYCKKPIRGNDFTRFAQESNGWELVQYVLYSITRREAQMATR